MATEGAGSDVGRGCGQGEKDIFNIVLKSINKTKTAVFCVRRQPRRQLTRLALHLVIRDPAHLESILPFALQHTGVPGGTLRDAR